MENLAEKAGIFALACIVLKECFALVKARTAPQRAHRDEERRVNEAIMQIAAQTELQTKLLEICAQGHRDTGQALREHGRDTAQILRGLVRLEGKLDKRAPN